MKEVFKELDKLVLETYMIKNLNDISIQFLNHASDILADTEKGLSGNDIVKALNIYAVEYRVNIPHAYLPFKASNKRTALFENIKAFTPSIQFKIIRELCEHKKFANTDNQDVKVLKVKLISQFSHLAPKDEFSKLDETLIEETRHWLYEYPKALELYITAINKYTHKIFTRNLLDDLRLSLELLLKLIFKNDKSLENQLSTLGQFVNSANGSIQFSNMFMKLIDYYTKYQNTYIKHDDAVNEHETEFVFELTSSFMRYIIRLNTR
ncbi:hypothetical protein RHO13_01690 [Orbus wheelerorum]|uniref:hypothetical protein n=1 Tax=Orbus wheelerorum TaxID=3074111 RepID=UPI00370DC736